MAHDGIYHDFETTAGGGPREDSNDIITVPVEVTTGLWSGNTGSIVDFFTSTTQLNKTNSRYFVDVYNKNPATESDAEIQFSLAYGHVSGAGSPTLTQDDTSTLSTKAVYFQFKNALLDEVESSRFVFSGSAASDDIYAISVSRARFKGVVDPGNWQLTLSGSSGVFTFIDDSNQTLGPTSGRDAERFLVASGSIGGNAGSTIVATTASNGEGYGWFYPSKGIIILNPSAVIDTVGFDGRTTAGGVGDLSLAEENTGSAANFFSVADSLTTPLAPFTGSLAGNSGNYYDQYNWHGLYRSIQLGNDFQARSAENISSQHYFIRLRNNHAQTSNNPTWIADDNTVQIEEFETNPKVFITTVGLYNNSNELLAVAKLSRPLEKSLTKEALIRVRLDF